MPISMQTFVGRWVSPTGHSYGGGFIRHGYRNVEKKSRTRSIGYVPPIGVALREGSLGLASCGFGRARVKGLQPKHVNTSFT